MQHTLSTLNYQNDFRRLPAAFFRSISPLALNQPEWVVGSQDCAALLGLDLHSLQDPEALALLSGNKILDQWQPLAMKYFGHQFGYLNPDLGDGRGLLLAEVKTEAGELLDLHLKGAGPTPFSRQGDGRAVLRSSIREFLCSEAMAGLGISSSRALCVINSSTPVRREEIEQGATLLRVSRSHIRFGHFEYAFHSGDPSLLNALSDYVAKRHFPCIAGSPNQNADLFSLVARQTAQMIAKWQCIGFAHGVMNTDNMSILGETFDFGPFGFMDAFDPSYICNHSDHQGRYAFDKQPAIAQWNLSVLAQAMSPIVDKSALNDGLKQYSEVFNQEFISGMRAKLGLSVETPEDPDFIMETLSLLKNNRLDYSYFFRTISELDISTGDAKTLNALRDKCVDLNSFDTWFYHYQERLQQDIQDSSLRLSKMQSVNPIYLLRNHLAQIAIDKAKQGDYSEVNRLHDILRTPFTRQSGCEKYEALPPGWAKDLEISCSS
jgi:protein adenylyltransferase